MRHSRRPHPGFSLLEVVLALGLMTIVIYIVAGGLDFHLRQLTVRKTRIEEAQLARAVLRRIADDLRGAVVQRSTDFASVGGMDQAAAAMLGDAGGAADAAAAVSTEVMAEVTDTGMPPDTPGVYGNAFELQVDVSRVPRHEEYLLVGDPNVGMPALLSDVKTVTYFMIDNSPGSGAAAMASLGTNDWQTNGLPAGQMPQGLARRVVDRAAARYANQVADTGTMNQQVEPFAPEVFMIQFRYFDGQQWLEEWDSAQIGGVPTAVEITLVLQSAADDAQQPFAMDASMFASIDPSQVYRMVVHLPASEPIDSTATSTGATP